MSHYNLLRTHGSLLVLYKIKMIDNQNLKLHFCTGEMRDDVHLVGGCENAPQRYSTHYDLEVCATTKTTRTGKQ